MRNLYVVVEINTPGPSELAALERSLANVPEKARDNYRFLALYGHDQPLVHRVIRTSAVDRNGDVVPTGVKRAPLRRRQWIESFIHIRAKSGKIVKLKANAMQRKLECEILRMERANLPVRIIILKSRKVGASTYIEGIAVERSVRRPNSSGVVVAHDEDTSRKILKMAQTMRDFMPKTASSTFEFELKHEATNMLAWTDPIRSEIQVASAKKQNPARGFTPDFEHLSELAFWDDAETKMQSLYNALPVGAETMCFIESTANGDTGSFRNRFWSAWNQRARAVSARRVGDDSWLAIFFPWYEDQDCRWSTSYGGGKKLPDEHYLDIHNTLTKEEEWLTRQRYIRRWRPECGWERVQVTQPSGQIIVKWRRKNCGYVFVDYDQLAFRRQKIRDSGGNPLDPETWDAWNAEYPARPEQAFLATGSAAFNHGKLHEMLMLADKIEPQFRGELIDTSTDSTTLEFSDENLGTKKVGGEERMVAEASFDGQHE